MFPADWKSIRFFRPHEFDSPDIPGSGERAMDFEFIKKLDMLRAMWGHTLRVNSGWRSAAHNAAVGGVGDSAHTRGKAADLATASLADAIKLAIFAGMLGFIRVGVDLHGNYIHVDMDTTLPNPVVWFYNA